MSSESFPSENIRVLLVDDHAIVRTGVRAMIDGVAGITVVAEASNGRQAVDMALALWPDVILMDLRMPVMDGVTAIRLILAEAPSLRILILTGAASEVETRAAVRAGALGYLSKDSPQEACVEAIHTLHRGEISLPPRLTQKLMLHREQPPPGGEPLTPQERRVLQLLAQGLDDREIARGLGVKNATVRTHVSNLLTKLALKNRVEATLYALRQGLISLEDMLDG